MRICCFLACFEGVEIHVDKLPWILLVNLRMLILFTLFGYYLRRFRTIEGLLPISSQSFLRDGFLASGLLRRSIKHTWFGDDRIQSFPNVLSQNYTQKAHTLHFVKARLYTVASRWPAPLNDLLTLREKHVFFFSWSMEYNRLWNNKQCRNKVFGSNSVCRSEKHVCRLQNFNWLTAVINVMPWFSTWRLVWPLKNHSQTKVVYSHPSSTRTIKAGLGYRPPPPVRRN